MMVFYTNHSLTNRDKQFLQQGLECRLLSMYVPQLLCFRHAPALVQWILHSYLHKSPVSTGWRALLTQKGLQQWFSIGVPPDPSKGAGSTGESTTIKDETVLLTSCRSNCPTCLCLQEQVWPDQVAAVAGTRTPACIRLSNVCSFCCHFLLRLHALHEGHGALSPGSGSSSSNT